MYDYTRYNWRATVSEILSVFNLSYYDQRRAHHADADAPDNALRKMRKKKGVKRKGGRRAEEEL